MLFVMKFQETKIIFKAVWFYKFGAICSANSHCIATVRLQTQNAALNSGDIYFQTY